MKEKSLWSSSTAKADQGGKGILISKDLTFTLSGLRQNLLVYEQDDLHTDRQAERMQGEGRKRNRQ